MLERLTGLSHTNLCERTVRAHLKRELFAKDLMYRLKCGTIKGQYVIGLAAIQSLTAGTNKVRQHESRKRIRDS
jgi:hypothetical protein